MSYRYARPQQKIPVPGTGNCFKISTIFDEENYYHYLGALIMVAYKNQVLLTGGYEWIFQN
jgi:hypothetical protein